MKSCSAYYCKNTSKDSTIRFFKFPETELRTEWVKVMRCKRPPGKKAYVCSKHFEEHCYVQKTIKLNKLKDDAIPTIFDRLPPSYYRAINLESRKKLANEKDVILDKSDDKSTDWPYVEVPKLTDIDLDDIKLEEPADSEILLNTDKYNVQNEYNQSLQNPKEFCRLCLGKLDSDCIPIWEGDTNISKRIRKCTSIQVLEIDNLKYICVSCSEQVVKIYAFQEMCIRSNEAYQQLKHRNIDTVDPVCLTLKQEIENSEEAMEDFDYESDKESDFEYKNDFQEPVKIEKDIERTWALKFFCEVCPMVCYNTRDMEVHVKSHEGRTIFNCTFPKCDKVFERYKECKKHYKDHCDENTVLDVCPFCGKTSKTRLAIGKHIRDHHIAKKFKCEICHKEYSSRHALMRHEADIHRDSPPIPCPQCDVLLKSQRGLNKHFKNVHYKGRQLHCQYCDRAFSTGYNLRSHLRTHTGETPFACPDCGQQFRHHVTMKQHRLAVHQINMFDRPPDDIFAQMKGRRKKKDLSSSSFKTFQRT